MGKKSVPISEKVLFWEEQDSINQVLIPRVLKNHELILELSQSLTKIGEELATIEGRTVALLDTKAKEMLLRNTETLEKKSQELTALFQDDLRNQSSTLRSEVRGDLEVRATVLGESINQHVAEELTRLRDQLEKTQQVFAKRLSITSWFAVASLAIGLLSLSLWWIGGR